MADAVDFANDHAEYFLQLSLQRLAKLPGKPSSQFCEDCDEPIPLARQQFAAGCETCFDCQELRERRR
ncbi:TraR/DksA C4-type zinc finger protein [Pseudomonas sp. GD03651]|uniref:TraR/DksA C4-type zinc finger protein n=1 Tax=Pseudomonas TaxID=286 RepID=UPI00034EEEB9|nr:MULTISPECIES: TraR/DksA C4-type zinc finger protein [Pseudomonas]AGN78512.1 molecular chaperone DnaK [Pseudomonas putida H8234]MDH2185126.1 TraR/DksA C4-type zinc finger protein [Pseudomonas sp. GD03651]HDS1811843.1 TraR/DksA C4-type zinc finger protein [Pseudomonas putida]HDS3808744.1 TraR/DksA C4-type zinc finger protein [Pseudomonas putida]